MSTETGKDRGKMGSYTGKHKNVEDPRMEGKNEWKNVD